MRPASGTLAQTKRQTRNRQQEKNRQVANLNEEIINNRYFQARVSRADPADNKWPNNSDRCNDIFGLTIKKKTPDELPLQYSIRIL